MNFWVQRPAGGPVLNRLSLLQLFLYQDVAGIPELVFLDPVIGVRRQYPVVILGRVYFISLGYHVWRRPCGHWCTWG